MIENIVPPLLKWPGGKRFLLPRLHSLVPSSFGAYIEPFMGGGALFFSLLPRIAVLGDVSESLVQCYIAVRDEPESVIRGLSRLRNSHEDYYYVRASRPRTAATKAARMIYLCTLSFNGIYRENLRGVFNVPYGHRVDRTLPSRDIIERASAALTGATLHSGDFERITRHARPGDLIYFDPPYVAPRAQTTFRKYGPRLFSVDDQHRLIRECKRLKNLGCHVIVSNASDAEIVSLYSDDFEVLRVSRNSVIAADSSHRRETTEMLAFHHAVAG